MHARMLLHMSRALAGKKAVAGNGGKAPVRMAGRGGGAGGGIGREEGALGGAKAT